MGQWDLLAKKIGNPNTRCRKFPNTKNRTAFTWRVSQKTAEDPLARASGIPLLTHAVKTSADLDDSYCAFSGVERGRTLKHGPTRTIRTNQCSRHR